MKKALVTGSEGFAGRHYVQALEEDGWDVTGVDPAGKPVVFPRDDALVFFRYSDLQFDLVIHCAAVVGGRAAIDAPGLALAVDLQLDAALFRWAVRTRPGRVVYVSSSAAYPTWMQSGDGPDGPPVRLREDYIDETLRDAGMPDQLYGWAKLTGEHLAYRARQEGLSVTVIRPFSGYGEDQDESYPFRAFAERARRRADPFDIWGSPRQCRDFIHIDDIVAATLLMCEEGIDGPANLGSGQATSMERLMTLFCVTKGYSPALQVVKDAPMGVQYRVADTTYMNTFYTAKVSLEEGIRRALT